MYNKNIVVVVVSLEFYMDLLPKPCCSIGTKKNRKEGIKK